MQLEKSTEFDSLTECFSYSAERATRCCVYTPFLPPSWIPQNIVSLDDTLGVPGFESQLTGGNACEAFDNATVRRPQ